MVNRTKNKQTKNKRHSRKKKRVLLAEKRGKQLNEFLRTRMKASDKLKKKGERKNNLFCKQKANVILTHIHLHNFRATYTHTTHIHNFL